MCEQFLKLITGVLLIQLIYSVGLYCNDQGICYPCYYRCQTCIGPEEQQCTQCAAEYVLTIEGKCIPCAKNCKSCLTPSQIVTVSMYQKLRCQTCQPGYYLSQSRGLCLACPTGASQCTLSSIQTCQNSYYLSNGLCLPCIKNCQLCSSNSPTSCQQCSIGYYLTLFQSLTEYSCQLCNIFNCYSCTSAIQCQQCHPGYSGTLCNSFSACPIKCQICYQSICYSCQSGYFLDFQSGLCVPLPLLCAYANDISVCGQCQQQISYMSQQVQQCMPYYSISPTQTQSYITSFNNFPYFITSNNLTNCKFKTLTQYFIYQSQRSQIDINVEIFNPIYQMTVLMRILLPENNLTNVSFSISNLKAFGTYSKQIQKITMPCVANNQKILIYNLEFNVIMLHNFNLSSNFITNTNNNNSISNGIQLKITNNINSSFGVVQILFQFKHCSIDNCQICRSIYSCLSCKYPFLLQDNLCVMECSTGYYLTVITRTCTLSCSSRFYPIFQDFLCYPCLSPCRTCTGESQQQCISCQIGWFLQNETQCVQECSVGFYPLQITTQNGICDECLYPCKQCSINNTWCLSCQIGYLMELQHYCTFFCPANTYLIVNSLQQKCSPCQLPCVQCIDIYKCTKCTTNFFLFQNSYQCVQLCPNGTIGVIQIFEGNTCSACQFPCQKCINSPSTCTSCKAGFLITQNNNSYCSQLCPIGYYSNFKNKTCQVCIYPCQQCQSQIKCTICLNSTYLYNSQCVTTCPNSTFSMLNICAPCIPPCLTCISQDICLSCTNSLFILYNSTCLLSCPNSTFLEVNNLSSNCKNCPQGCISCIIGTQCLKCTEGYLMITGINLCSKKCPQGMYIHYNLRLCLRCNEPCLDCEIGGKCLSCIDSYLFEVDSNKCYLQCPTGYYNESTNKYCHKCDPSCLQCMVNSTYCMQCSKGYFLQPFDSINNNNISTCSNVCPQGYFPEPIFRICQSCEPPCLTCQSTFSCLSCLNSNPFLFQMRCLSQCPQGMYEIVNNSQYYCNKCSDQCQKCFQDQHNCTSCRGELYILESIISNYTYSQCLQTCPKGYYNYQTYVCYECQSPCLICVNSPDLCLSCVQPYLFYFGTCIENCPSSYYADQQNICKKCSQQCKTCQISSNNCTSCFITGQYLLIQKKTINLCINICPATTYADQFLKICKSCEPLCYECLAQNICTKCFQGFFLVGTSCLTECPDYYYKNNNTCILCQTPCLKCVTLLQCTSCVQPYYYINIVNNNSVNESQSQCVVQCPSGTYAYSTAFNARQCLTCSNTCEQCFDFSACKSCKINSSRPYLQQNDCVGQCSSGFYSSNAYTCKTCSDKCILCQSQSNCTQCISSYLFKGYCYTSCPDLFYGDPVGICYSCRSPCQKCYDSSNCITCQQNYYLYQTFCLEHCPKGMWSYPHNRTCQYQCNLPYRDTNNKICMAKCDNYYRIDGQCVDKCKNIGIQQIVNMTMGCQICQGNCTETPQFRIQFINKGEVHSLALIFSSPIVGWQQFAIESSYFEIKQQNLLPQQIYNTNLTRVSYTQTNQTSASRLLLQSKIPTQINYKSPSLIIIKLPTIFFNQASSLFTLKITNQLSLISNNYPLQNKQSNTQMGSTYITNYNYSWFIYIGWSVSILVLLLIIINLFIDNTKSLFLLIQIVQSTHLLNYLQIWYHPAFNYFIQGLSLSSFYFNFNTFQSQFLNNYENIWGCNIKKILYMNSCNYKVNLLTIMVALIILLIITVVGGFIINSFNTRKHKIFWNHINDFYWIFGFVILFAALDAPFYVYVPIISVIGLLSLKVWYESIKNIFNNTYAQSTFFWSLKKGKTNNPFSNSIYPMTMCRRLLLTLFISLFSDKPIFVLSLTLFNSILIAVNVVWNKPYKKHTKLLPTIQCLIALFLFILQINIVNMKTGLNMLSEGLAWGCLGINFCIIGLAMWVGIQQTIKQIKYNWKKYKKSKCQNGQKVTKTSNSNQQNTSKNSTQNEKYSKTSQPISQKFDKQQKIQPSQINNTIKQISKQQNDSIKTCQLQQATKQNKQNKYKNQQMESYWDQSKKDQYDWCSQLSIQQNKKQAAKYLIKINKNQKIVKDSEQNGQGKFI